VTPKEQTPARWALEQRVGTVFGKALLLAVCADAGNGAVAVATARTLAAATEMSEDSVRYHLEQLERANLVLVQRHGPRLVIVLPGSAVTR
jgi:DNA-binding transcriptional ArsR family regulator